MHAHLPPSVGGPPADRFQHRGAALGVRRLVGEDVVDLVAAAARGQPADVRALPVSILEFDLGFNLVLVVRVLVLGKAEVDERTVPCVAKRHMREFRPSSGKSLLYKLQRSGR